MPLDPWSVVLALVLSVFGFLVFLLWNKRYELGMIEKKAAPAAKESLDVLIKNFLSFGDIPSKSKLISIMTSVARKHQVQLLTSLSIPNVIDNLVYHVISNDLLDPYKKKEISDSLIRLKLEPIAPDEYIQMVADNEEVSSWRQKLTYAQLTKVLISASLLIVVLGITATQFKTSLGPQGMYLVNWLLVSTIGFSGLVAGFTFLTVFSYFSKSNKQQQQTAQPQLLNAGAQQDLNAQMNLAKKNNNPKQQPMNTSFAPNKNRDPLQRAGIAGRPQPTEKMAVNSVMSLGNENKISEFDEANQAQSSFETI
jgi:hypothetical protein